MVEMGQPAAPWPAPDTQMNLEFQQPYMNNQVPPCSATTDSSYEPLHDFGFEHSMMQQALEDW